MTSSVTIFWPSFVGVALLILVHLLAPRFHFMQKRDSLWLPASVGVAVSYVFLDIFPHIAKGHGKLTAIAEDSISGFLTHHVYLVALVGFVSHLGLTSLSMPDRTNRLSHEMTFLSVPNGIKVQIISLIAYIFLIGYLLSEQATHRPETVFLFAVAMAIHFAGVDCLLREHFSRLYDLNLRFTFSIAVFSGWLTGIVAELADTTLALLFAFLAGEIIIIATVYELPRVRSSRQHRAFVLGVVAFSGLMLAIEFIGK